MKLYAFWHYDTFPFVLGSPVRTGSEMRDDGRVQVDGYGGAWFLPFKLLPVKKGKEVHEQLKALEAEYEKALASLKVDFEARREEILSIPPRSAGTE